MSETLYLAAPFENLLGSRYCSSTGVSQEASTIQKNVTEIARFRESSRALFGPQRDLLNALEAIQQESSQENWDGYGAIAISPDVIMRAKTFIRALPPDLPMPEISAEPDGEIAFDWIKSPVESLSVSINAGNRAAYAWMDGTEKGYSVAKLDGIQIPERIHQEIKRMIT